MFTSINKTLRFRVLVPLKNQISDQLFRGLDTVLQHYNNADFQIKQVFVIKNLK